MKSGRAGAGWKTGPPCRSSRCQFIHCTNGFSILIIAETMAEELQLRIHGQASLPTLIYLPGLHGDWTLIGVRLFSAVY